MRLGDLDALKKALKDAHINTKLTFDIATFNCVMNTIDNAPTVVNEYTKGFADGERSGRNFPLTNEEKAILVRQWLPQGKWIFSRCDKCGAYHDGVYRNFCPNCGADMREEVRYEQ